MKPLHLVNALLWVVNATLWALYAHSIPMAIISLCASVASYYMSKFE